MRSLLGKRSAYTILQVSANVIRYQGLVSNNTCGVGNVTFSIIH